MKTRRSNVYVIGSLRNPYIPEVAAALRRMEVDRRVFDNWYAAGPEADDHWQAYEKSRGHGFVEALRSPEARNTFEFDKRHLDECDAAVLLLPAGKSGHLELGYIIGMGKPGFILLDGEPERYDVMYNFATGVHLSTETLDLELKRRGL